MFDKNNYSCISLEKTEKENKYSLGLEQDAVLIIMKYINDSALLTPYSNTNIKVLGNYDESSIVLQNISFIIKLDNNNELKSLEIKIDGTFKTMFEGSRDFTELNDSDFDIKLTLNVNDKTDNYVIPTKPSDLKGLF